MEIRLPSGAKIQPFSKPVHVLEIGEPGQVTEVIVHNGKLFVYNAIGQTLVDGGIIQTQGVAVGLKSWVHNIVFSATDQDTAAWASGTIYFGDGSSKAINAGNTGNITEKTYVYYDGTSILKKTTSADFLDDSYILLATIEEGGAGEKCIITVSQLPSGTISAEQIVAGFLSADRIDAGTITADKIAANTITADEIAANTITGDEIVGTTLSAITANLGTITAGSITGITITGSLFRTAASGDRVEIDANIVGGLDGIHFIEGSNDAYVTYSSTRAMNIEGVDNLYFNQANLREVNNLDVYDDISPNTDNSSSSLGFSTRYFNQVYAHYVRYKDIGAFQDHNDIALIKKIKTKEIDVQGIKMLDKKGKVIKGKIIKKDVWDETTMPSEIYKDGFYDAGEVSGLIIGTLKQLIEKIEGLEALVNV